MEFGVGQKKRRRLLTGYWAACSILLTIVTGDSRAWRWSGCNCIHTWHRFEFFFSFFSPLHWSEKNCKMSHLELLVAEILRVEASSIRFLSVDRKRLVLVSSDTALVYCDCRECQTCIFCVAWKDKYVKTHRSHGPFMIFQYCICSLGKVEMTSNCWYFELAGIIVRRKVKPCQLVPAHLVHQLFFLGLRTFPNLNIIMSFLPGCKQQYQQHISRI